MLALLRTRRWLGFTVTVLLAIVAFGLLSRWQWSRAEAKRAERAAVVDRSAHGATPIDQVLAATDASGTAVTGAGELGADVEWRSVTATGRYEPASTVLVRKRPLNGANGFWVATALRTDTGRLLWINRGWIPATADATAVQRAPDPPAGLVTVTGRLRAPQSGPSAQPRDLPAGQVTDLDIAMLSRRDDAAADNGTTASASGGGSPVYPAYLELTGSDPADSAALTVLPPPDIDDTRNLSYAVQWILFALVAVVGWGFFLRREAREDARAGAQHTSSGPPPPAG
ncbi:MAG: SURF1 family protein [Actinomycetota bacterium]|nr:MAG: SURF1 family protein [Actinomycetota bacterium]